MAEDALRLARLWLNTAADSFGALAEAGRRSALEQGHGSLSLDSAAGELERNSVLDNAAQLHLLVSRGQQAAPGAYGRPYPTRSKS